MASENLIEKMATELSGLFQNKTKPTGDILPWDNKKGKVLDLEECWACLWNNEWLHLLGCKTRKVDQGQIVKNLKY